jgi:HTH-type transcriptional regulator / antitoxin HigA
MGRTTWGTLGNISDCSKHTAKLESLTKSWKALSCYLCVPRSAEEYGRLVDLLDALTDEVGEDEGHPLASLMDVLGNLIESYESARLPEFV